MRCPEAWRNGASAPQSIKLEQLVFGQAGHLRHRPQWHRLPLVGP